MRHPSPAARAIRNNPDDDGPDASRDALTGRCETFDVDGCRHDSHRAQVHDRDDQQDRHQTGTAVAAVKSEAQAVSPGRADVGRQRTAAPGCLPAAGKVTRLRRGELERAGDEDDPTTVERRAAGGRKPVLRGERHVEISTSPLGVGRADAPRLLGGGVPLDRPPFWAENPVTCWLCALCPRGRSGGRAAGVEGLRTAVPSTGRSYRLCSHASFDSSGGCTRDADRLLALEAEEYPPGQRTTQRGGFKRVLAAEGVCHRHERLRAVEGTIPGHEVGLI
jgi:hypothetical protein